MTSKIRPLTILFSLGILTAFGTVSYVLFIKKGKNEFNVTSVTAIILFLLMLAGFFAIIWLTLIVKIDKQRRTITLSYPFRLQSRTFNFDEIVGYRYKYLNGRITYKSLQLKTKSGQTFTFSDFETLNLREFENEFIKLFDLRSGKYFTKINQQQKESEIKRSNYFDKEQAKEIRFYLSLALVICVVLIGDLIKRHIKDGTKITTVTIIAIISLIVTLIATIIKLKKTNQTIKDI